MFLARFENRRFGGHWRVGLRIGESESMLIYLATSSQKNGEFAVKVEARRPLKISLLRKEFEVYSMLNENETKPGFLKVQEFFAELRFFAMLMHPYGKTLATLYKDFTSFSQKTLYMVAIQCLGRLETLHINGFVHCAVAPENFAIGVSESTRSTVHLINLQHAQRINNVTAFCMPSTAPAMTFASATVHRGMHYSKRDDLISLCYLILYFHNGRLPWSRLLSIKSPRKRNERMLDMKYGASVALLCQAIPPPLHEFVSDVMELSEGEVPNYDTLRSHLNECLHYINKLYDNCFDWTDQGAIPQRNATRWPNFPRAGKPSTDEQC